MLASKGRLKIAVKFILFAVDVIFLSDSDINFIIYISYVFQNKLQIYISQNVIISLFFNIMRHTM